jgi:hypothetical protein
MPGYIQKALTNSSIQRRPVPNSPHTHGYSPPTALPPSSLPLPTHQIHSLQKASPASKKSSAPALLCPRHRLYHARRPRHSPKLRHTAPKPQLKQSTNPQLLLYSSRRDSTLPRQRHASPHPQRRLLPLRKQSPITCRWPFLPQRQANRSHSSPFSRRHATRYKRRHPCTLFRHVNRPLLRHRAELSALFYNAKDACTLRTTLSEMGNPQPSTPIQTDNSCAAGIANDAVKQRQ